MQVDEPFHVPDAVWERDLGLNLERGVNATVDPRGVDADATDPTPADEPLGGPAQRSRPHHRSWPERSCQVGDRHGRRI
jgi:hypothetical protein